MGYDIPLQSYPGASETLFCWVVGSLLFQLQPYLGHPETLADRFGLKQSLELQPYLGASRIDGRIETPMVAIPLQPYSDPAETPPAKVRVRIHNMASTLLWSSETPTKTIEE